jgi:rod shape determining protein RodA
VAARARLDRPRAAPLDPPLLMIAGVLLGAGLCWSWPAPPGLRRSMGPSDQSRRRAHGHVVVAQIPPQRLMQLAVPIYLVGVLLLVGVALFGEVSKGARRWLNIGFTRIQPSEMMKIAMPLMLAWYFHRTKPCCAARLRGRHRHPAIPVGTHLAPARPRHRDPGAAPPASRDLLSPDCRGRSSFPGGRRASPACRRWRRPAARLPAPARVLTLLDPRRTRSAAASTSSSPPSPSAPAACSARAGRNGTQTHLEFIPERHTDFIFAVMAEEFGLLGCIVLLVLYALIGAA